MNGVSSYPESIVAIATPSGYGGVGIVRISGSLAKQISVSITEKSLIPRQATFCYFKNQQQQVIDHGIALFFSAPNSFTGEDVLELQGHGGPVVMALLVKEILSQGCRLARPGEFSERAFLNDKMDLTQAEAVADLIHASTEQAAKSAMRSLNGDFSDVIHQFNQKIIYLRTYIEASLDFSDEEIDFMQDQQIKTLLDEITHQLDYLMKNSQQGVLMNHGVQLAIVGRPNAGKSSLLNCLAQNNSAIVTDIPGTTRDILKENIQIDGLPINLLDTAGLRVSNNIVEQEGIKRTWDAINKSDNIFYVLDDEHYGDEIQSDFFKQVLTHVNVTLIRNKIDKTNKNPGVSTGEFAEEIAISVKNHSGIDTLKDFIKNKFGFSSTVAETSFSARTRHVDLLKNVDEIIKKGIQHFNRTSSAELLAEDLRQTHQLLGEMTGEYTSDDLLGNIFSSFCIGK
ncbi:MAG: tRNA uridine-5-carboxymethylaminomethyl(34) synthesis GTPase MnmE [Methylococcales bacterium]|jgi:tRNA modification GTPase|nr:tRNA uridine-5-carboxymethylaminomethyl(34) synthesis GTPase MnmE [Methylococcales bacterium]MBT7411309.1 tRNA uridine-5-carboxymethylaminomethyl(34) synthesis GTPase MnmE [Methylococcales bacterium]